MARYSFPFKSLNWRFQNASARFSYVVSPPRLKHVIFTIDAAIAFMSSVLDNGKRMRKLILLGVMLCSAVVGVTAGKLHSLTRHRSLCSDVPCAHYWARLATIESVIAQKGTEPSYLAIGDSIVELADLPKLCGRRAINAGIGGATVETFETNARKLAELAKPDFVIVEIGTNDALQNKGISFQASLSKLLSTLTPWRVIVVPLPPGPKVTDVAKFNKMISTISATKAAPLAHVETTPDGVHLTAESYVEWKKSIADAAQNSVCN